MTIPRVPPGKSAICSKSRTTVLILLAGVALTSPAAAQTATWRPVVMGRKHMVASGHYATALAGHRVLEQGGNALDAAVAATLASTVVEPARAGIGGHLMIMTYVARTGQVVCIDGSGWSGRRATREYFQQVGELPFHGPLAPVVPGAVDALYRAHRKFGRAPWARVVEPARELASEGFAVSAYLAGLLEGSQQALTRWPSTRKVWFPEGRPLQAGDWLVQPDLAQTLGLIAAGGRDAFYRGPVAKRIVEFLRSQGGILEEDDFAAYQARESEALHTSYRGYEIYDGAPHSFDHITLEALNILEAFDLRAMGHNSARYLHNVTEAMKQAFADRDAAVDDPDYPANMPRLVSKELAARRRALIRPDRAWIPPGASPAARSGFASNYALTTFVAAADKERNLVSITSSLSGAFGNMMYVDGRGGGFFLNNWTPLFQLDPKSANVIAPRKVPRTGWSPMLAFKEGKPALAFGTPGGDTIPQTQLQFVLNYIDFGMNVQQALEQPTVITSAFRAYRYPNAVGKELAVSARIPDDVREELRRLGHSVTSHTALGVGSVKAIAVDLHRGVLMGGAAPEADAYVLGR